MITVAELRERVLANASHETLLAGLRSAVVALWEAKTAGKWDYVASEQIVLRPDNGRVKSIWLPRRPVASVTTVEERGEGSSTWTTLETDDFVIANNSTGEIERINTFWAANLRVTYSGGYTATTCPGDIKEALIIQARYMLERYDGEKLTVRGQSFGKGAVSFLEAADMHPLFKSIAALHRRASYQ